MSSHTRSGTVPWPAEVAERYRAAGYWEDRSLGALLRETADRIPQKTAIVDGSTRVSYAELTARADAGAERLRALGLQPDDRLLIQLPNAWQFVALTIACFRAGVIPVMALPAHRRYELTHLASVSECRGIVVPDELRGFDHQDLAFALADELADLELVLVLGSGRDGAADLDALLEPPADPAASRHRVQAWEPDADSPACFLISGGTTGLPKLITRTHNDYALNLRATAAAAELGPDDVYLGTLPSSHNFPLACPGILGTLLVGGSVVMLPSPEPVRAFATVAAEGVTIAAAVPAVAQRWVDHQQQTGGAELATLRVLQVGGSRLPDEYARRIGPVLGCTLQQVFGMAEGLINTTRLDDPDEAICATQGRPVHEADEVRVLDADDRDVPDGTPGALYTRGPYTPPGYYNAPEHNVRSFLPGGWYGSGDVVVRRPDGNLIVQGRNKDMINRGGEKISAEEIESLVYTVGGVEMNAAVAMPDAVLGERLCLYLVPEAGVEFTLDGLRERLAAIGIAAYKLPDRLELVPELPMTKVGKIDKRALRQDAADRAGAIH